VEVARWRGFQLELAFNLLIKVAAFVWKQSRLSVLSFALRYPFLFLFYFIFCEQTILVFREFRLFVLSSTRGPTFQHIRLFVLPLPLPVLPIASTVSAPATCLFAKPRLFNPR